MGSGWVHIYTLPSHTRILKSGKTHTHAQTQSKREKTVKLGLVRAGNHKYEFCCHA